MNIYQVGLEHVIKKRSLLNSAAYMRGFADSGYDVSWSNIFDGDITFSYNHADGIIHLKTSEWLSKIFIDDCNYVDAAESWFCNFTWNRVTDDVKVICGYDRHDDYGNHDDNSMLFSFKYPLSEEQYFQRSLIDEIPISMDSLNEVLEGMKTILTHKDDEILSWLRG